MHFNINATEISERSMNDLNQMIIDYAIMIETV